MPLKDLRKVKNYPCREQSLFIYIACPYEEQNRKNLNFPLIVTDFAP